MAASKARRSKAPCPNCKGPAFEIWFIGNDLYDRELLETHCNRCGWAIDGEGNLRNPGRSDLRPEGGHSFFRKER